MEEMTLEEMREWLPAQATCRLGLQDGSGVYVVPLSYVYDGGAFYIHLVGGKGHKANLIEQNPEVCVEVDAYSPDHLFRRSVIAFGRAERVTDRAELLRFMEKLAEKYPDFSPGGIGRHPAVARPFLKLSLPLMADKIAVYRVVPERMTGRKSEDGRETADDRMQS